MRLFVLDLSDDTLRNAGRAGVQYELQSALEKALRVGVLAEIEPKAVTRIVDTVPGLPLKQEQGL